jgi:hypothetical protein
MRFEDCIANLRSVIPLRRTRNRGELWLGKEGAQEVLVLFVVSREER